ncbi:unnamed protein product [Leptidea sinapis]|uniref:Uncharacterized protein n=1 Tax=Leptidea sinapis TaxID=189913 RepID=A0A5E4QWV6_9NEOP|nr:unnamed protein product [Leptidea sinapis]
MSSQFMPRRRTGRASVRNSCSMTTASSTIWSTRARLGFCTSSLLNVSPGMRPRFFSQNIEAKLPEKNIPSTAANATILSPKLFGTHRRTLLQSLGLPVRTSPPSSHSQCHLKQQRMPAHA